MTVRFPHPLPRRAEGEEIYKTDKGGTGRWTLSPWHRDQGKESSPDVGKQQKKVKSRGVAPSFWKSGKIEAMVVKGSA